MAYIGVSPSNGVRRKHTYTATANQTSFSGAGAEGATLSYNDSNFVDVYQNGVKLSEADYTSTSGTAIVLAQGASVSDIVEVVVYDVFSVADTVSKADGGTFDGNITAAGTLAVTGNTTVGGTLGVTGVPTFTGRSVHSGGITIANAGQIGSVGDADAISISSSGVVTFSQTPVGAGSSHGKTLISTTTTSNTANVTLSFSGYETYLLQVVGLVSATDNVAGKLEWSADDGSSYITGNYSSNLAFRLDSTGANSVANPTNNAAFVTIGSNYDSTTTVGSTVEVYMPNLSNNILTGHRRNGWYFESGYKYNNIIRFSYGGFHLTNTSALNKLRFTFSSGNIATGVFKLFGIGAV